jgi:hypothetical protein
VKKGKHEQQIREEKDEKEKENTNNKKRGER